MKDMIYYPGFEIQNENWLKFALLYFDTLRPIIPQINGSKRTYFNENSLKVMKETNLIVPYEPDEEQKAYAAINACDEFEKYLRTPERYSQYFGSSNRGEYVDKWQEPKYQDCTLFKGKYSEELFKFCIDNKLATKCHEGIRISSDLAFVYMSFLADIISKENEYEMITDVQRYSQFLRHKDLSKSKTSDLRIKTVENEIRLMIPSNLTEIPLEKIIELRNSKGFDDIRKAYIGEVEQQLVDKELNQYDSRKKFFSYKKEFISICEQLVSLTAYVTINAYSLFSIIDGVQKNELLPVLAAAVIDFKELKDVWERFPNLFDKIKTKHLARKYVACIENLNKPAQESIINKGYEI